MTSISGFDIINIAFFIIPAAYLVFPPSFGNRLYGIPSEIALRSEVHWKKAHQLYTQALLVGGFVLAALNILGRVFELNFTHFIPILFFIATFRFCRMWVGRKMRDIYPGE